MHTLRWKRRLGALWELFTPAHSRRVILLYHSLGPNPPAVEESRFRQQIAWLASNASIVSLDSILKGSSEKRLQVAITFDDGYASLRDKVAPILVDYGATATVYLNTGRIGEELRVASNGSQGHYPNESFMTWTDVEALTKMGWTIGSHGIEHIDLTQVEPHVAVQELRGSKCKIETKLNHPCRHFAYTWGRFTPALRDMVQKAQYVSAASGLHGPINPASDRFSLPRLDVRAEYELRDFVDVVTGHWDYLGLKQRLGRLLP